MAYMIPQFETSICGSSVPSKCRRNVLCEPIHPHGLSLESDYFYAVLRVLFDERKDLHSEDERAIIANAIDNLSADVIAEDNVTTFKNASIRSTFFG